MELSDEKRFSQIREQIKEFPAQPGLYVMKDSRDRVLYIGKAKNLRSRAGSYFQPSADLGATRGPKIVELINKVHSVDYLEAKNEVDAVLQEARLIKDIKPPYNTALADDKSFPYLMITSRADFPGVYITRQPQKGTRLFGPFTNAADLRPLLVLLQKIFKFRTCKLDIRKDDPKRRFFRPCLLYSINRCTAPCADNIAQPDYKKIISDLVSFLKSKRSKILRDLRSRMAQASAERQYEKAAMYRDRIGLIERLDLRGTPDEHVQPELFADDPTEAMEKLTRILRCPEPIRTIEGIDIAHISGTDAVGSLVKFIDGRPFKEGYRRFKIRTVQGIDDYAMIAEVVRRRYKYALQGQELWPDLILIDGGLGQLHAAQQTLEQMNAPFANLAAIAKKEETIFLKGREKPVKLSANNPARKLLQYVRDESHRFAQHYHKLLRTRRMLGPDHRRK